MVSDLKQLEINFNLHSLQPGFVNSELYYILARDEKDFRFANWNDEPVYDEKKYYCFLSPKELFIPSGNITLQKSYVVREEPFYPSASNAEDFLSIIHSLKKDESKKAIRRFYDSEVDKICDRLQSEFGALQKHLVQSDEAQHLLIVVDDVELSVSSNMVYFRHRAPFSLEHYEHVKEQD